MALLMSEAPPDEQSGDTHLSTHKGGGREQAQLLAGYWGPILRGKQSFVRRHPKRMASAQHKPASPQSDKSKEANVTRRQASRLTDVAWPLHGDPADVGQLRRG